MKILNSKIFIGFAIAGLLAAQSTPGPMPEPQAPDVFFRVDTGKLVPLEKQDARANRTKPGQDGKGTVDIAGAKSPVRFRTEEVLMLVVKSSAAQNENPAALYHLGTLRQLQAKREIVMSSPVSAQRPATAKTGAPAGEVPVTFSRYGAGSVLIKAGPLQPGEYFVGLRRAGAGSNIVFCFGID